MLQAVGSRVEKLARVRIGALELGDLPVGRWRELEPREVAGLAKRRAAPRRAVPRRLE